MMRLSDDTCLIVETKGPVNINLFQRKSAAICWEMIFTRPMFETGDMQAQHDLLNEVAGFIAHDSAVAGGILEPNRQDGARRVRSLMFIDERA